MILLPPLLAAAPLPSQSLRAHLDRVAQRCHLPRSAFKIDARGRLHVQPPAWAGYREFDCAFAELKKEGVDTPLAIVGREVPGARP
jgi:hypothetical protein